MKTSKFTQRFYGLEGMLAHKNFKRNKRRYRSVILSLTLSVVLFVAGNAFGTTLKQLAKVYTLEMDGDIAFYTQNIEENELFRLYGHLKNVDGVYNSTYQAVSAYPCVTRDFPTGFLTAYRESTDDGTTGEALQFPLDVQFIEDGLYSDYLGSLGLDTDIIIVGANTVEHTTYFTDSTMDFTLTPASGGQGMEIRATFADRYPLDPLPRDSTPEYFFMAVAPWRVKPQFDALGMPAKYGLIFWSNNPAISMAQIQAVINETGFSSDYTLINLSSTVDLFRSATFVVDVFTYVFVMMISLIAVANVFNTISTNIRLRRHELAMLRSVGMSERGFKKMMNFECAFYGIRTLLFGVPIAWLFSWLVYKGMTALEQLDQFPFTFPWGSMAVSIAGVFSIVFITMIYATDKIKKENIIDALRDDLT